MVLTKQKFKKELNMKIVLKQFLEKIALVLGYLKDSSLNWKNTFSK